MLLKNKKIKLTELLQDQFPDLSIARDKPLIFENGEKGLLLIIKPVLYMEHDIFLKDMAKLILKHYEIFGTIDFLNSDNYLDKNAMEKIISKISIFEANKKYSLFKKDTVRFLSRWAYVTKKKRMVKFEHNKRLCKKYLKHLDPSEFINILFLTFVRNFDIVKKNLLELMKIMHITIQNSNPQMGMSSPGMLKEAVVMPKFSQKPYPESTLNLFEQQSKM